MSRILLLAGALLAMASTSLAMMIEGKQMTIDDAIIKAGSKGSMTGMFEIMQDKDTVMVELDMLYNMSTYTEMRKDMEKAEKEDAEQGSRKKRKAIRQSYYRWTGRRVPYEISYGFSASDRQMIMTAINDYHRYTCIRFVPASRSDTNRVRFQNGNGCSSYVGMIGRTQPISLARGCRYKGIIIHEMGHAIGFQHEQTRPDRDGFVTIQSRNIQSGVEYNFMKYTNAQIDSRGVGYDYTSVMHYGQNAFSRNGRPTIIARNPRFQNAMGNRDGLSFKDIELANNIYSCAEANRCPTTACSQGFRGPDCKCWCDSGDRRKPVKECDGSIVTARPGVTTPPTTVAPMRCEDMSQYCPGWAGDGLCTGEYETYMMSNCKLSCNYCQMSTTTTTTMATPPIANCEDNSRHCRSWADNGECQRNPSYMLRNCKRSCNACNSGPSECIDMNTNCPSWRRYCDDNTYKDYLSMNCMRSCNVCTASDVTNAPTTTPAPEELSSSCMDIGESSYCKKFTASSLGCTAFPMVRYRCTKTCEIC